MAKVSLKCNAWVGQIAVGINCTKVWDKYDNADRIFFPQWVFDHSR